MPRSPASCRAPGSQLEGEEDGAWKDLGRASKEEGAPSHCHSAEEELFAIVEGTLELWQRPQPDRPRQTEPHETRPLRAGHVIFRLEPLDDSGGEPR